MKKCHVVLVNDGTFQIISIEGDEMATAIGNLDITSQTPTLDIKNKDKIVGKFKLPSVVGWYFELA
jgi:tRNA (Thr-GGU) A37 N-methylase